MTVFKRGLTLVAIWRETSVEIDPTISNEISFKKTVFYNQYQKSTKPVESFQYWFKKLSKFRSWNPPPPKSNAFKKTRFFIEWEWIITIYCIEQLFNFTCDSVLFSPSSCVVNIFEAQFLCDTTTICWTFGTNLASQKKVIFWTQRLKWKFINWELRLLEQAGGFPGRILVSCFFNVTSNSFRTRDRVRFLFRIIGLLVRWVPKRVLKMYQATSKNVQKTFFKHVVVWNKCATQ